MHKLSHRVVFPFELKLINTSEDCPDADTPFDLFAVVVHMGAQPHHGEEERLKNVGSLPSPALSNVPLIVTFCHQFFHPQVTMWRW